MRRFLLILTIFTCLLCIPLIFWGKLYFVGGDDTNLYYLFPKEYLQNISIKFISDNSPGTLGSYLPNMHILTFNIVIVIVKFILSNINTQLLFFGLNLAFGFLFFYIFLTLFLSKSKDHLVMVVSSLLYTFSTFTIYTLWQSHLFAMYLVSLFPFILFLFIKGLRTSNILYLIFSSIVISIFNIYFFSLPWFIALAIGAAPLVICTLFKVDVKKTIKPLIITLIFVLLLNAFWLFHMLYSTLTPQGQSSQNIISKVSTLNFRKNNNEIIRGVTSLNSLTYPMLGLFHKEIQNHFNWPTYSIFEKWHEKFMVSNSIFLFIIIFSFFYLRKTEREKLIQHLVFLLSWLVILFLFTVRIGNEGVDFFIWLNENILGFVMFRNMYDKFGLALAFTYSVIFASSLSILFDNVNNLTIKKTSTIVLIVYILICAKPFIMGDYYNLPIYSTKNIFPSISEFNSDFTSLTMYLSKLTDQSRILWLPMSNSGYIQISDRKHTSHYYSGISPLRILANVSDFSGRNSFPLALGEELFKAIADKNYTEGNNILKELNVRYIIINHDIPFELKDSIYGELYGQTLEKQYLKELLGTKIMNFGQRYSLYSINEKYVSKKIYITDKIDKFPNSFKNLEYRKISSNEYYVSIKNLNKEAFLVFLDPYHELWKLRTMNNVTIESIKHQMLFGYANEWELKSDKLRHQLDDASLSINSDGTLNVKLKIYFEPGDLHIGLYVVSGITFIGVFLYLMWVRRKNRLSSKLL